MDKVEIKKGEKLWVWFQGERKFSFANLGPYESIPAATPERRILNSSRVLISGFDWAEARLDAATGRLAAYFDSTATGLTTVGTYYVQVRCTIEGELYEAEAAVEVKNFGP